MSTLRTALALFTCLVATVLHAAEGDVIKVGQPAPAFVATASDGSPVTLAGYKGQVVLLNFFATWCGPCLAELPVIERDLWTPLKAKGLVVLAVGREHTAAELAPFKKSKGLTFPLVADPKRDIYGQYASAYIPRCYLIGKDGLIKMATTGFEEADFQKLKAAVADELAHGTLHMLPRPGVPPGLLMPRLVSRPVHSCDSWSVQRGNHESLE